jgi:hypothetical protein
MTRLDHALNIIVLALVLAVSLAALSPARAGEPAQPVWLWPQQSIAVAQSTSALVTGRPERAAKFALRGLKDSAGYDRVVALHNLCLALVRLEETDRAQPVCDSAMTAALALERKVGEPALFDIVEANIARERGIAAALAASARAALR